MTVGRLAVGACRGFCGASVPAGWKSVLLYGDGIDVQVRSGWARPGQAVGCWLDSGVGVKDSKERQRGRGAPHGSFSASCLKEQTKRPSPS